MIKVIPTLAIGAMLAITAGCANGRPGGATAQSAAAEKDYQELSGTWQLTRGVVNGRPVPASVLRNTVLITDRNIFRFPKASGVGTHPAGHFTVNPDTRPKQVDSIAEGGPNAGEMTPGIYEILDANHKRACWGTPGWTAADRIRVASGKQTDSSILEEDWSGALPLIAVGTLRCCRHLAGEGVVPGNVC